MASARLRLAFARTHLISRGTTARTASIGHGLHHDVSLGSYRSVRCLSTQPEAAPLNLPDPVATSAGKVLNYINTQCKDDVSDAHIMALVNAMKEPRDYSSLLHAITTFKRTRGYVMSTEMANAAIAKVLDVCSDRDGALWVLENFKERTGLYFSASTSALNMALDALHADLSQDDGLQEEPEIERIWKALVRVTEGLIRRKTLQGGRGLKKRAKRKYLHALQTKGGPTQHTIRRVAEIGVLLKTAEEARETLVEPYIVAEMFVHSATIEWIEAEKRKESGEGVEDGEVPDEATDEPTEEGGEEERGSEEATDQPPSEEGDIEAGDDSTETRTTE